MAAKSEQSQVGAKLNTLAVSCYRIILNIKRLDNVSNDRIYDLTGTSHLLLAVISRQLKFLGHRTNPLRSTRCMSSPTGEDSLGDRFSHRVQEWIDPKKHFLEDDIVRIA